MKFDTYLFDFDGTLVDSMPTFVSAMLRILDAAAESHDVDKVRAALAQVVPTYKYTPEKETASI